MNSGESAVLVTGAAGFIGYHVTRRLLDRGVPVIGIDNLNPYYDISLKQSRLDLLSGPGFEFLKMDIVDRPAVDSLFSSRPIRRVVHLAAQAGVRHSLLHPHLYGEVNLGGFLNILEAARHSGIEHLVFASSSSVYGANVRLPFSESDNVDHPVSLYAATKKANELMAHAYASLYQLPATGLRFFTVYGPWGRPDMALFKFTRAILAGEPIEVFNQGKMIRDFTYIDDVSEGVVRVLDQIPRADPAQRTESPDPSRSFAPYRIFNIGNNQPVELLDYIRVLEKHLGKKATMQLLPIQPGDVPATMADVTQLQEAVGFKPATSVDEGVGRFVAWYREYYRV